MIKMLDSRDRRDGRYRTRKKASEKKYNSRKDEKDLLEDKETGINARNRQYREEIVKKKAK